MSLSVIKALEFPLLSEGHIPEGHCNVDGSAGIKNSSGTIISAYRAVGAADHAAKTTECDSSLKHLNADGAAGSNYPHGRGAVTNVLVVAAFTCITYNTLSNFNPGGEATATGSGREKP